MTTEPWPGVPLEVAPVRAGEELRWDRLAAYLAAARASTDAPR